MISQVELTNFKRFGHQVFDVQGNIVLAGPNNTGKTTLIQALSVWNLTMREWLNERSGSKATIRTGIQIPRSKFTAIPLREMNLLWNERTTAKRKSELLRGEKLGTPRPLEIKVTGHINYKPFHVGMSLQYRFPDLILTKPTEDTDQETVEWVAANLSVLFVPSFSGIDINETRYDKPYQDLLLGQGKPGDIIRNKMLEVFEKHKLNWDLLVADIQSIFNYTLLPPQYAGQPYIICDYVPKVIKERPNANHTVLDIASAGSGFLQVILLLSFFYSQDSSLVLFDEPDAHLHIILQRQVYDKLRTVAIKTRSQLMIATHSEIVIDSTSPENILSFYREPHRLTENFEAEQVRLALKQLTSMDIIQADRWPYILYLEGKSDFNLLREWAFVLGHPLATYFNDPEKNLFWHNNIGRNPKSAKEHLFALRAVNSEVAGILLLDGDDRNLPSHEFKAEGLEIIRWIRYEAENYLLIPAALKRFVSKEQIDLFSQSLENKVDQFISKSYFNIIQTNPFTDDQVQKSIGASKEFLPALFSELQIEISKQEYYQIAQFMKPEEIHPEVKEKLDFIYQRLIK